MITLWLILIGLCFGSFVNALVWRVHEQEMEQTKKNPSKTQLQKLSITRGRSICPNCGHELASKDLIPLFSWLSLRGKCRYCRKPISVQYPLVEVTTAALFVASFSWWSTSITGTEIVAFAAWLAFLTGLMALLVYDLKWFLLPNRIMYPLVWLAGLYALIQIYNASNHLGALLNTILAVVVGGGIFYGLFQVSKGKWIGGGDVKLGWLLGLVAGTPGKAFLFIFLAAAIGSLISLPLLVSNRLKRTSVIPFGPLLIIGAVITVFFGSDILHWYRQTFLTI
jgi:prepilin signal peptidase PulO-like enzyme (type II secretory pathway)